jgi:hypothetical protein
VEERRKGAIRPSTTLVKQICIEFAQVHSLSGVGGVGRRNLAALNWGRNQTLDIVLSANLIDQVDSLLPPQPWPQGTHLDVAEKLGVAPKIIATAVRHLIDTGRRYEQIDGELFDDNGNLVAPRTV